MGRPNIWITDCYLSDSSMAASQPKIKTDSFEVSWSDLEFDRPLESEKSLHKSSKAVSLEKLSLRKISNLVHRTYQIEVKTVSGSVTSCPATGNVTTILKPGLMIFLMKHCLEAQFWFSSSKYCPKSNSPFKIEFCQFRIQGFHPIINDLNLKIYNTNYSRQFKIQLLDSNYNRLETKLDSEIPLDFSSIPTYFKKPNGWQLNHFTNKSQISILEPFLNLSMINNSTTIARCDIMKSCRQIWTKGTKSFFLFGRMIIHVKLIKCHN